MRIVSNVLGVLFVLLGLAGFASPHLMGMNLSTTHNIVHLIVGVLALWFGIAGSERGLRNWLVTIGVVGMVVGIIGFFFGAGTVTLKALAGLPEHHLWKLVPNHLEFGTADDVFHLIAGIIFLIAGLARTSAQERMAARTREMKEKVAR